MIIFEKWHFIIRRDILNWQIAPGKIIYTLASDDERVRGLKFIYY